MRYNPEISKGIVPGQILKIPVSLTNSGDQKQEGSADNQAKQLDVSEYSVHPVVSGETLYSLEQRYGVSHEDMLKFNPSLANGLKAGMKLKIPAKSAPVAAVPLVEQVSAPNDVTMSKYRVEKGETLFSLAARFGVDVADIKKANPSLFSRSLETGEIILIPQQSSIENQNAGKKDLIKPATEVEANSPTFTIC